MFVVCCLCDLLLFLFECLFTSINVGYSCREIRCYVDLNKVLRFSNSLVFVLISLPSTYLQ